MSLLSNSINLIAAIATGIIILIALIFIIPNAVQFLKGNGSLMKIFGIAGGAIAIIVLIQLGAGGAFAKVGAKVGSETTVNQIESVGEDINTYLDGGGSSTGGFDGND